jgi:hypothetical protein
MMNEKTKPEKVKFAETTEDKPDDDADESARGGDRDEKSYYYDDACGYEIYNPDEEENETDREE